MGGDRLSNRELKSEPSTPFGTILTVKTPQAWDKTAHRSHHAPDVPEGSRIEVGGLVGISLQMFVMFFFRFSSILYRFLTIFVDLQIFFRIFFRLS